MGCTQSDKENFYNFFNARKINGAIIGEKANEVCQSIVGSPFLIGQINTASKVQLAWTGGEGSVKYIIYQSTNNFTFIPVAETTNKEFLVTGLDFLTTYFFRVDAVSYLGDETQSNVITFTMPNVQAPTGLTLDYPDIREVVLTWASNSNEDEEGFVIERSLDEITWTDIGNTTTGVETYTDLTVIGDLTYFYRVAAFAGVNKSSYSNTVSQFIPVIPTPQDLIAEVTDPTKINLSWTSNSFGDETGFSIERSLDGITFTPYDQVPSGQNTFFDINITIDVEYFYRVQALESGTTSSGYTNVASAINNLTFRSFNNFDFGFHQFGEITDDKPPLDTDVQAWSNATGITDETELLRVNTLVTTLKSDGNWDNLDYLLLLDQGSAGATDVKSLTTSTAYGSVTFNSSGADSQGVDGYIDTNIDLSSLSNYSLNDNLIGGYITTGPEVQATSNNVAFFGAIDGLNATHIFQRNTNIGGGANNSSFFGINAAAYIDGGTLSYFVRENSMQNNIYNDGVNVKTDAVTTTGIPTNNLYLMGRNNNGTVDRNFEFGISLFFIGSSSGVNHAAFNTAIRNYLGV